MSVHCFEIVVPPEHSESDIRNSVDNYLSEFEEVLIAQEVDYININSPGGSTDYFLGEFRFSENHTMDAIKQDAMNAIQDNFSWGRLRYHQCLHDESGPCSWDNEWTHGTVPSDV